jgi:isopenicillin N synthase-like dioxygenase
MTALGRRLCALLAIPDDLVADPTVLFRIFRYPPSPPDDAGWGVAEHTDYGLLTILRQDHHGGLEVRTAAGDWLTAPPIPGSFVCNVGDMLERLSGGRWRSTPHRVRHTGEGDRLSFPFFFDPSWDAPVPPVSGTPVERWDGADLFAVRGSYGEYLLSKVAKVFPDLGETVLDPSPGQPPRQRSS